MLPQITRERLYKAAVDAAKAVNYKNAGTVEFIVDEKDEIYFLEMNTRLQVEHPITEEVTGYDLVEWQIEVAKGHDLPVKNQQDINIKGHALEFRVYAEDPITFMPSPGTITKLNFGNVTGVRIDSGYAEGGKVTPFYDPLISKVIVHANTRDEAIEKAKTYFNEIEIEGLKTNVALFTEVLKEESFSLGTYTTAILDGWSDKKKEEK